MPSLHVSSAASLPPTHNPIILMTDFRLDSRLVALLCAPLPISDESQNMAPPLSPKQWYVIQERLVNSSFRNAEELFTAQASTLTKHLNLSEPEAEQIHQRLHLNDYFDNESQRMADLGIWILTALDTDYPPTLQEQLGMTAPPVLFGAGNPQSLGQGGLGVVGPRNAADSDLSFAKDVGEYCANEGIQVISGGAKGIDQSAMMGAVEIGGQALGVLGDSLEKHATTPDIQHLVSSGQMTLVTPYHPKSRFEVGKAMGRNRLIYALADWALVVNCQEGTGGTWHGATTALKSLTVPVFVRMDEIISLGNKALLQRGAIEFPPSPVANLAETLDELSKNYRKYAAKRNHQPGLFDNSN